MRSLVHLFNVVCRVAAKDSVRMLLLLMRCQVVLAGVGALAKRARKRVYLMGALVLAAG
jgi:hypothetical protein